MSEQRKTAEGMATAAQLNRINELTSAPGFTLPLASFLKNITGGTAASLEELTYSQANDVIGIFAKFKKKK